MFRIGLHQGPNVDGLEFPISEEKERYGDLAYREERTGTVPEHDFCLSTRALSFGISSTEPRTDGIVDATAPRNKSGILFFEQVT